MKQVYSKLIMICMAAMCLVSCGEGSHKTVLPPVTGAANEILVIMHSEQWNGPIGDTLKQYFGQEQIGLPQPEPMFDLINLPPANFKRDVKSHRSVIMVDITPKVDTASFVHRESPWSQSQKVFEFRAPNAEAFYKIFNAKKSVIMGVFLKAERDRWTSAYKKSSSTKIFNLFKNKYNLVLNCPDQYRINKDTNNFVWISSETRVDSKGLIFFQEKYTDQSQLNYQVILDRVNEELKAYIPGPAKNSYMALDTKTQTSVQSYNYNGENYAILMRGLWEVENDFMGGPYVLNVVLDQQHGRIIYMMGYIYAPESGKRNMIRQVEAILFTMGIIGEEVPAENGK
ncbi:MAG: DUF4837 family protein [Marinifilaceae bacterium]